MSSTSLRILAQPGFVTWNSFVKWTDRKCPVSSPVQLSVQKLFLASDKAFKFRASLPRHDITRGFKLGELGGHCYFSIICRQVACRHCLATRAVCAEPHASCWMCHSIWHQLVAAVFNELWKQKLIKTFVTLCKNITTKIMPRRCHHIKLVLPSVEVKRELLNSKLNSQKPSGRCI